MKTKEELADTLDILLSLVQREIQIRLTIKQRREMMDMYAIIAWVMETDPLAKEFVESRMSFLIGKAREIGFEFRPRAERDHIAISE